MTFTGAVGSNVSPGTGKHVIWDAGRDIAGKVGDYKARVFADDGHGPSDMVLVASGYFNYQNITPPIFLPSFFIDKYEVTNALYCEFLNNADPCSAHYDTNMEIDRTGSSGNYSYTVKPGKDNYPIHYVSYDSAVAFAQWRSQVYGGNYRLPTEQEWEKAAAWDPVQQYYYIYGFHRDAIDCNWCNYNNCTGGPMAVGSYNGTGDRNDAKSYYGCYDMSGNVYEWTSSDWGGYKVIRGGSWSGDVVATQCISRSGLPPSSPIPQSYWDIVGFRLVLDSE
jgi:formylglycine-generating enzyme required for sulfatase activity